MLLAGCSTKTKLTPQQTNLNRTPGFQKEIDQVIIQDTENKRWARLMLLEIDNAIMNDDYQAYIFFLHEYEIIPKEIVPEEFRTEPGYTTPVSQLEEFFRLRMHLRPVEPFKPTPEYTH